MQISIGLLVCLAAWPSTSYTKETPKQTHNWLSWDMHVENLDNQSKASSYLWLCTSHQIKSAHPLLFQRSSFIACIWRCCLWYYLAEDWAPLEVYSLFLYDRHSTITSSHSLLIDAEWLTHQSWLPHNNQPIKLSSRVKCRSDLSAMKSNGWCVFFAAAIKTRSRHGGW